MQSERRNWIYFHYIRLMFSVLPSELLLSDQNPPFPPTSSLSFLCSQTPLRQGCEGADLLWFSWTRRRQREKEVEDSLRNSPGPLILTPVHTCFPPPQNLCILPKARRAVRGTRAGEEEGVRGGKNRTGSAYRQRFSRGRAEEKTNKRVKKKKKEKEEVRD